MIGIAIHLNWAELIALDQHRHCAGNKWLCGREVVRLAENQVFWRFDVGVNRLIGLLGATSQSRERHRRAHQLHEAATRNRIDPLLRRARELALHRGLKIRSVRQFIDGTPVLFALDALQLFSHLGQTHRRPISLGSLALIVFQGVPRLIRNSLYLLPAHRWQTSQLVSSRGVRILYCFSRKWPSSSWLVNL